MKPIKKLQIGKNGLTEQFIEQVKGVFKNENLIKISLLQTSTRDKLESLKIAETLLEKLGDNYTYRLIGYTLTFRKWGKSKRQ